MRYGSFFWFGLRFNASRHMHEECLKKDARLQIVIVICLAYKSFIPYILFDPDTLQVLV
jgi:hypothetical protein